MSDPFTLWSDVSPSAPEKALLWTSGIGLYLAPFVAGLVFAIKWRRGEKYLTIGTGLWLASLWTVWVLVSFFFVDFRRDFVPRQIVSHIWVFLYLIVFFDWVVGFWKTGLRYWKLDGLTLVAFLIPPASFIVLIAIYAPA